MDTPTLFFGRDDLPHLRARAKTPALRPVWDAILRRADGLSTPGGPWFLDAARMDAESRSQSKLRKSHLYGRRLTVAAEVLGFAYQLTGEARYGRHGAELVAAAAARFPVSDERVAKSLVGGWGVTMRGFAIGLDWLGEAMREDQRAAVHAAAADYVRALLARAADESTWWVPYHNFMGVTLGGAGCAALMLRDACPDEAQGWIEQCASGITRWLDQGFDDQGAYYEGVLYAHFGLENSMLFADALQRHDGRDLFDHFHLRKVSHFLALSLLPGERAYDARNDSHYRGLHDPFLLRLADAHQDGLSRWLWEESGSGCSPLRVVWDNDVPAAAAAESEPTTEHFAGRGLCIARTGWSTDDVMFSIEAGPYYAITHNQADKGHVTLYGLGHRWAIDSGYGNNHLPGGADQTVAHNCVLIDGEGQALSGAGLGTDGRILSFKDTAGWAYALADATPAYNANNRGTAGIGVRHALRHAIFIRPSRAAPAYAVVLDDICRDDARHDYTWLLHTDPDNGIQLAGDHAIVTPAEGTGTHPQESAGHVVREWVLAVTDEADYSLWVQARTAGALVADLFPATVRIDDTSPFAWYVPELRHYTWDRVPCGSGPDAGPLHLGAGDHVVSIETHDRTVDIAQLGVTSALDTGGAPDMRTWTAARPTDKAAKPVAGTGRPRMLVAFGGAEPVRLEVDTYDDHPRLRAVVETAQLKLATLLIPLPDGTVDPDIAFTATAQGLTARIVWPQRTDEIHWLRPPSKTPVVRISGHDVVR